MDKVWRLPEPVPDAADALQRELECLPITAQMLWQRGYRDVDSAHAFLSPAEQSLDTGCALTDLDKAVARLHRARQRNERVRIFGDYDVDGVSATALMLRALHSYGIGKLDAYIPEREVDGYGIASEHIRRAAADGVNLVVTVDNGITAHEAAQTALETGIEVIVSDHHHFDCDVPAATACVNPKRDGTEHPLYHVSGATVAWLIARALTNDAEEQLGYAALGTVSDVMPLTGYNRPLVAQGLRQLGLGTVMGITALAGKAKVDMRQLRAEHIAFQLGPRLNAGGRMGNARAALDLLLATDTREAARLSRELDEANLKRRRLEREILKDAIDLLKDARDVDRRTIVLGSERWPKGIIGIVAAKVAEKYDRPTALLSFDPDGFAYASARSRPGFDLIQALNACSRRLTRYGGHQAAAGFTLPQSELPAFVEEFEAAAAAMEWDISPAEVSVDAVLSFTEITPQLIHEVARMEPFGHGNPEPVFCTCNAVVPPESVRVYNGGHLGLRVEHHGRQFPGIAFGRGDWAAELRHGGGYVDVLYRPKFNTFRNRTTIQLQIEDIRPSRGAGS